MFFLCSSVCLDEADICDVCDFQTFFSTKVMKTYLKGSFMFDICTSIPVFFQLFFVLSLLACELHVLSVLLALIYDLTHARSSRLLSAASCFVLRAYIKHRCHLLSWQQPPLASQGRVGAWADSKFG